MLFPEVVPVSFLFLFEVMTIQVNTKLLKSRNPTEHGIQLNNEIGRVVQVVGDGWYLIEFKQFQIKVQVKEGKKKVYRLVNLQWYVHQNDFQ